MNQQRLMQVLLAPQVSEKATYVADKNEQVVFRVASDATRLLSSCFSRFRSSRCRSPTSRVSKKSLGATWVAERTGKRLMSV